MQRPPFCSSTVENDTIRPAVWKNNKYLSCKSQRRINLRGANEFSAVGDTTNFMKDKMMFIELNEKLSLKAFSSTWLIPMLFLYDQHLVQLLKVVGDGKIRIITKRNDFLMDYKSDNTHHGSMAIVELNRMLLELGLLIKFNQTKVKISITEVTNMPMSGSRNVMHEGTLKDTNEGNNLEETISRDGFRAKKAEILLGKGSKESPA